MSAIWTWMSRRRTELRLAARVTIAAVLSFAVAHALGLPQGYWAVFTAVFIMQASVGGSIKAIVERLIGTFGGAFYGALVATLIPHGDIVALGIALAVALAPLALLAAINPSFRVAPITAVILLLGSASQETPIMAAFYRLTEVGVGSLVGLIVSLVVLPARAHRLMGESAKSVLDLLAQLFVTEIEGLKAKSGDISILHQHDRIRLALTRLETAVDEAARERTSHLTDDIDPDPIARTIRRLRHDLVMIGRAASEPLPAPVYQRLEPILAEICSAVSAFFHAAGLAFAERGPAPPLEPMQHAFAHYARELILLRKEQTEPMPGDAVSRTATLGFAFEQLKQNCADLAARAKEFARKPAPPATPTVKT